MTRPRSSPPPRPAAATPYAPPRADCATPARPRRPLEIRDVPGWVLAVALILVLGALVGLDCLAAWLAEAALR